MKYRFEILYEPREFSEANNLMHKLDLGWETVALKFKCEISTNRDYEETDKVKDALKTTIESEGFKVHDIKGGTWS